MPIVEYNSERDQRQGERTESDGQDLQIRDKADAQRVLGGSPKSNMNPFKNASNAFKLANPHLLPSGKDQSTVAGRSRTRVGLRCGMNKTESEFALMLEARKRAGEILRYEFEGITLRFANVKYTPDFVVFVPALVNDQGDVVPECTKFIEVKGPFIKGKFERAVERFRHARTYWSEFSFELHQKTKNGWKQIE